MLILLCMRQLSSLNCVVGICKGLSGTGQLKLPEDVFLISPFSLLSMVHYRIWPLFGPIVVMSFCAN